MLSQPIVRPEHLARKAVIYIRQSTFAQVRKNVGSTIQQYDLKQRALDLGWSPASIEIIDEDLGRSGTTSQNRNGFQTLVAEVGLQRVGAVFSLEVSRLARANSDWHQLLEICALTDTLVIDEDGLYDPSQYNDRLLLGIKGTMSEAELHWLHQRLRGGSITKAKQGMLRFQPPAGLVHTPGGHIELDPDEEVQSAVRLVFSTFDQYRSAMAVVKYFKNHELRFPTRTWGGARHGELAWEPLRRERVLSILHNPAYAGAYVYGRTRTRTQLFPGETPRVRGCVQGLKMEDWLVFLPEAHPGYITWAQFLANAQYLDDNRTDYSDHHRGAAREGGALLQGIIICGHCGHRLVARYTPDRRPMYECRRHTEIGGNTCQCLRGEPVDEAVTRYFLEAIQPAQLEVSLAAADYLDSKAQQIERQWQLRLERVRYEAQLARRRFLAVDPDNRLVARTLEQDWNTRLADVEKLEREYEVKAAHLAQPLSREERQQILALTQDLPALWNAPTTTHAQRKQLLRLLIKDVTVTRHDGLIDIGMRWQTGALTPVSIPRLKSASEAFKTAEVVIHRLRELAPTHTDRQIAQCLNQEGYKPGRTEQFTRGKVKWLRQVHHIASGCKEKPSCQSDQPRGDGRYSARVVAAILNIHPTTVESWCRAGKLDAIRADNKSHAAYWIKLTPDDIKTLTRPPRSAQ